jgi:DNA polymerase III subunit delta
MPPAASKDLPPLVLVCGDDDFAVKQRARQIFQKWCAESGTMDQEIIDGTAANSSEALSALNRLREALQTLPFFGSAKVIWFQNCNFLGDERTASASLVTESLAGLAQEFKSFNWSGVQLLISAGKVDKRKTFFKTIDKVGAVETFAGWSVDDKDWALEAESAAGKQIRALKKSITAEALARLVAYVGPNSRQLHNEIEKLALYVGNRLEIETADVDAVVTRNKQSRAFALGDALGARDLPRVLRTLDEEIWEVKLDSQKSEIGLLYGLISKIRVMLFLKEMLRQGWLKPEFDFGRFKTQLERIPTDALPQDRRFNPLSMNPYVLFKALGQVKNYTIEELVRAMEILLECNQRLISSGLEETLVLQQALVKIVSVHGPENRAERKG